MPSPRQIKLAERIVENLASDRPKGIVSLVESVGYSEKSASHKSGEIVNSDGVREALIAKGFSVDRADEVVTEILNGGKGEHNRLKAADMIYERLGAKAVQPQGNVQNNFFLSPEAIKLAKDFEEAMKKNLYAQATEEVQGPLEALGNEAGGSEAP